jgi:hypothetical protein
LEVVPRRWKVIQTVRERFSCRDCERIMQPPAPFHVTPRGFAGPHLLATILVEKFAQHQPLNRQSERFAREGIELSVSTLADQVGACTTALTPLFHLIEAHVLAAERLHADDTTVPILAKGRTTTGRIWTYVRDDRPFGGPDPPAGAFLRFARPIRRAPRASPGWVWRDPAGRRLWGLQRALWSRSCRRGGDAGLLLGTCTSQVLRTGPHCSQRPAWQPSGCDLADRARGGQAYRRPVRD